MKFDFAINTTFVAANHVLLKDIPEKSITSESPHTNFCLMIKINEIYFKKG